MFLNKLKRDDPALLDAMVFFHRRGELLPDSYVIDLDQFRANASAIRQAGRERNIKLYFMLKQLGRNPVLARELVELGYDGAVTVDFREAQVMMRHRIPIGNVGHLVQVPESLMERVAAYGPEVITVFTLDKARSVSRAAQALGKTQKLLIRVFDAGDRIYSGQTAGVTLEQLPAFLEQLRALPGVQAAGVTSFPCFLYEEEQGDIVPTPNLQTVLRAREMLLQAGFVPEIINTPSATCSRTIELIARHGGTCGEPGHGLTGTTPAHAAHDMEEKCCAAYISEVSHNFNGLGYCYGGGFYRRGHVENALVGTDAASLRPVKVIPPDLESIDYHFGLDERCAVGETVIMAFRYQIFVTRSDVVLLEGISQGRPRIAGVYDSLGNQK